MLTVRFPTGLWIQYNTATFVRYVAAGYELYTADPERGGRWVATVQSAAGVVVEAVPPCHVEHPRDAALGVIEQTIRRKLRARR